MDLLTGNQNSKPQKTTMQKIVLTLLIVAVVLLIFVIAFILLLSQSNNGNGKITSLKINNQEIKTSQEFIISTSEGETYVELRELSNLLNYTYYNGAYLEFSEDRTKCYIDTGYEIIGFEQNSNIIYKTLLSSTLDYQYYDLSGDIISYNNKLYIQLIDLPLALNLVVENGSINTTATVAENHREEATTKGYSIDTTPNNLKAIAYDLMIVSKDSKKGIVNKSFEEIVGTKYNTIEFNEKTKDFIVSSNNKYGLIKSNSETKIRLIYDEIRIANYEPLLYIVKKDNKLGIINGEGEIIANTEYDKIGYDNNIQAGINYTFIIPSFDETVGDTIVVAKNNKYGLIEIESGKIILECNTDGIYQLEENQEIRNVVNLGGQIYSLNDYLEYAKRTVQSNSITE